MNSGHVFAKWNVLNHEYLQRCSGRYVAVTYSGGKDPSVCLSFLAEAGRTYGFDLGGYSYAYPRHRYTPEYGNRIKAYWEPRGVPITYREADTGDDILDAASNPCRPCQDLRKQALPELFELIGRPVEDVVIVSGHSLWDLAGYALDRFTADALASSTTYKEAYSKERFLEISQRFFPFLSMPEGYSVYRPMLFLNASEIELAVSENSLPVLETPCRYSLLRPKKVLGNYFRTFGYEFTYDKVLEFAKRYLEIAGPEEIERISQDEYLTKRF